jgi:cation:H+ antiporter
VTLETFIVAATASVAASVVLVTCLERVGERWRLSEALLGLVVALAADGPEITSAITAMVTGQRAVGVGVVIGSNVFNLAALLGLGAIIAGRLALPRVSVALEGVLASTIACIAVAVAARWVSPLVGLTVALLVSNAFNVIIGLLIPAVLTGVVVSGGGFLVAIWYLALTVAAVVLALVGRGLGRLGGIVIVGGYVAFVVTVIAL